MDEGMTAAGTRRRGQDQEQEQEQEQEWEQEQEQEQGEGEGKEARTTNTAGRRQRGPTPLAPPSCILRERGTLVLFFFVTTHIVNRQ